MKQSTEVLVIIEAGTGRSIFIVGVDVGIF